MTIMANPESWNQSFRTLPSRAEGFVSVMLDRLPPLVRGRRLDVLDLGCGTGALAFRLASACADAHVTGIDISQISIAEAERTRLQSPFTGRLRFIARDYMDHALGPFDLIYADSSLHLIQAPNEQLFAKLVGELKPGGHLVCSMPYRCLFNSFLFLVRRCLRLIRCRAVDHAIFSIAVLLHGKSLPLSRLRERVPYMYLIPPRVGSKSLERQLAADFHLECRGRYPYPHSSLGQPRHDLWIFHRPALCSVAA
jgi:SAM-dependent methyltransferase